MERDALMEEKGLTPETRSFFKNFKKEGEIDDLTFDRWKTELQKDLPIFWESMTRKFSK
jgi:hypothetical protein